MYPHQKKTSSYGDMNQQSSYQNQQYYRSGYDNRGMNTNQDMRAGYQHGFQQIQHQGPPRSPHYHHQDHRSPSRPPRSDQWKAYGAPQGYNRDYNNHGSGSVYRQHHTPTKSPSFAYNSNRGPRKPSDQSKHPLSSFAESKSVAPKDLETRKELQNSKQVSFVPKKTQTEQKSSNTMDSSTNSETSSKACDSSFSTTVAPLAEVIKPTVSEKNEFISTTSAKETNDKSNHVTNETADSGVVEDHLNKCDLSEISNENNVLNSKSQSPEQQSENIELISEVIDHSDETHCEVVESIVEVITHCEFNSVVEENNYDGSDEPDFEQNTHCDIESTNDVDTQCNEPTAFVNSQCDAESVDLNAQCDETVMNTQYNVEPVEIKADEVDVAANLEVTEGLKLVLPDVVYTELNSPTTEQVDFDACHGQQQILDNSVGDFNNCETKCLVTSISTQEQCVSKSSVEEEGICLMSEVSSSELKTFQEFPPSESILEKKDINHELQNSCSGNYSSNEGPENIVPENNIEDELKSPAHEMAIPTTKQEVQNTPMKKTIDNELTGKLNNMYITPAKSSRKSRALIDSTNIVESSSIAYVTREIKHKEAPSEVIITPVRRSTRKKTTTPGPQELSQEKLKAAKVVPNPFLNA